MRRPILSVMWVLALFFGPVAPAAAQTYAKLYEFSGLDGRHPVGSLIQAADGAFYGTTLRGGPANCGVIFRMATAGAPAEVLHSFDDAANPPEGCGSNAALIEAGDGAFYGVTGGGGANDAGTLFVLDATQTPAALTVLHHFGDPGVASDGAIPASALILAPDDRLYGTTLKGGAHDWGTVFAIDPFGTSYEVLFSFGSANFEPGPVFGGSYSAGYVPPPVGAFPASSLLLASDWTFYGTTMLGGNPNGDETPAEDPYFRFPGGTVFQLIPPAEEGAPWTVAYHFNFHLGGGHGDTPLGALIQTSPTTFRGTTSDYSGVFDDESIQLGTIFELDRSEEWFGLYTVHQFTSDDGTFAGGALPAGALLQASDGFLYGTTLAAGPNGGGVVFRMNGANEVSIVHAFGAEGDSADFSSGPLIEAADGSLYGTAGGEHVIVGGSGSPGTIFRLSYKTDQTIDFAPLANKTLGDADFVVSAAATSNLTVTFAASGSCTISGASVHLTAAGNCTITASQAGNSAYNAAPSVSRSFVIATPAVTLTLSPASVTGGTSATATVTLTSPAPNGGAVVTLSSSAPGVAVPATVSIMKGKTTKTFTVTTSAVTSTTGVVISAAYGGTTATTTLTVTAPPPPPSATLSALSLTPKAVKGGTSSAAIVTLTGPAPAGGLLVTLTSSLTGTATIADVTVAPGATSATATITTNSVSTSTTVTITATGGGVSKSATLTVRK